MKCKYYFDNNASSPLDPAVKAALEEELSHGVSNPSSPHRDGQAAKGRLNRYRKTCADYFGVPPKDVIFTSSGTESLNFLIESALKNRPKAILSSDREHSCVYNKLKSCPETLFLKGDVTVEAVEEALGKDVGLIVLMAANNESGVMTDIAAIGRLAQKHRVPFIVDGVALLGKERFVWPEGVSAFGFSGHKIHAPSGVGCVVVKPSFKLHPLIVGGAQEYGLRAGTENMAAIAAFSKAVELIPGDPAPYLASLRDRFEKGVKELIPSAHINGSKFQRISNTSNILFEGADGEGFLMRLDELGLASSLGSACTSGALEPSRVLLSMGLSYPQAKASLRFSFSRMNTLAEVDEGLKLLKSAYVSEFS